MLVEAFQSVSASSDPLADAPAALTAALTKVLIPINDVCVDLAKDFDIQVRNC
jgi:hypothetical protein